MSRSAAFIFSLVLLSSLMPKVSHADSRQSLVREDFVLRCAGIGKPVGRHYAPVVVNGKIVSMPERLVGCECHGLIYKENEENSPCKETGVRSRPYGQAKNEDLSILNARPSKLNLNPVENLLTQPVALTEVRPIPIPALPLPTLPTETVADLSGEPAGMDQDTLEALKTAASDVAKPGAPACPSVIESIDVEKIREITKASANRKEYQKTSVKGLQEATLCGLNESTHVWYHESFACKSGSECSVSFGAVSKCMKYERQPGGEFRMKGLDCQGDPNTHVYAANPQKYENENGDLRITQILPTVYVVDSVLHNGEVFAQYYLFSRPHEKHGSE